MNLPVGQSREMNLQVLDQNGNLMQNLGPIVWSSNHTNLATVNPTTGMVTGVAAGVATITATFTGGTATLAVTVYAPTVGTATITPVGSPGDS